MLTGEDFIKKIKNELYDITSLIYTKSRTELINSLSQMLKDTLQSTYVGVYVYENWRKEKKLQSFANGSSL